MTYVLVPHYHCLKRNTLRPYLFDEMPDQVRQDTEGVHTSC